MLPTGRHLRLLGRHCCTGTLLALLLAATPLGTSSAPRDRGEPWGREAIDAYVAAARTRTLQACASRGLELPADFLAWIDGDPVLRASVYGCRREPLAVLLGLRSLEIDLGADLVRRDYPQLALAFAIQHSYAPTGKNKKAKSWNDGDEGGPDQPLPDISQRPLLQLSVPGDPRVRVDTKATDRELDRDDHIINFLEDHAPIEVEVTTKELPPLEYDETGVARPRGKAVKVTRKVKRPLVGADVIASAALQTEFETYLRAHGHDVALDCGDQVVHWQSKAAVKDKDLRRRIGAAKELFHTAYRNKGRMPAERDRTPSAAEAMAWLIRNDRHPFSAAERKARQWPRFPLNAPWPLLLMLAADDQPLREREDIWIKFRDRGEFRTYGEYIGGIAQQFDMQSARRVSPIAFNYGSIQMMWKDGGVCGTMGNIGARTFRICGVPSSTAGQPGHCALVRMEHNRKTGEFGCKGGQYATGGDAETTVHAGWNYDDRGGRRPMVFHQSVTWGVNHGLASFVDGLVLRRLWDTAAADTRADQGVALVQAALAVNPFALAAVVGAIDSAPTATAAIALFDAFTARFDRMAGPGDYALYRRTVRDLAHTRVLTLPAPAAGAAGQLLADLERQGCESPRLLARCWRQLGGEREFTRRSVAAVEDYLASPLRTRNNREARRFTAMVKQWQRTVKARKARKVWAEAMLAAFAGKEALRIRKKVSLDPVVALLCKVAGREAPTIDG